MQIFEIEPRIGIGPIKFGMHQAKVRKIMGQPDCQRDDNSDDFLSGFRVDYDLNNRVEFIELSNSDKYEVYFKGVCLHKVLADEAVEQVSKWGSYCKDDPELGYSYIFQDLQLSLWRGILPEPKQPDDNLDGRYFEAIGLGVTGYFDEGYFW
jgi:hypothetical protein